MDIKNTIFNPNFYQHFLPSLIITVIFNRDIVQYCTIHINNLRLHPRRFRIYASKFSNNKLVIYHMRQNFCGIAHDQIAQVEAPVSVRVSSAVRVLEQVL